MTTVDQDASDRVRGIARAALDGLDLKTVKSREIYGAWFDSGLAWIHFPTGRGGLDLPRDLQNSADDVLVAAGVELPRLANKIGYGIAAPTLVAYGQPELLDRLLRPLATGEEVWCQLFSEPGAGSDLAGLATTAVRTGDGWCVNGQKVWSSQAHRARWGVLLARTDPGLPKHKGLTYFVVDMTAPGVEVRPLRQMTGQSEFNEVFLNDVFIPDSQRLGAIGEGWRVARTTLANERSSMGNRHGGGAAPSAIEDAFDLWRRHPERRTPLMRDRLTQLWMRAEAHRLTCDRFAAEAAVAGPGHEGSIMKLVSAELNQAAYEWCVDFLGTLATRYDSYDSESPPETKEGLIMQRFLRSRANTIEGGTSEILRNIIAERMLDLPAEARVDLDVPWREVRRS